MRKADKGEFAFCGPSAYDDDPANDPSKADNWGHDREIRADLVRWLCVNRAAKEMVDPKGIQIYGAKIPGALDLVSVVVPFPFQLAHCRLLAAFNLIDAEIPGINLDGSWVNSIVGDGAKVRGHIFLRADFRASGGVRFPSARIGGFFDCSGGSLTNLPLQGAKEIRPALEIGGAVVGAGVFLRNGFRSDGEVRLHRIRIEVDLDCRGGTFSNPPDETVAGSGKALTADGASLVNSLVAGIVAEKICWGGKIRIASYWRCPSGSVVRCSTPRAVFRDSSALPFPECVIDRREITKRSCRARQLGIDLEKASRWPSGCGRNELFGECVHRS
jgi:hypothetical protein